MSDATFNPVITSHSTFSIEGQYRLVPEPNGTVVLLLGIAILARRLKVA
ncbi:MAG: hypothetical protein KDB27_13655 [Planctomycetales bacterium]|nr:hypothetical protein [Planctomycetales bacterium]